MYLYTMDIISAKVTEDTQLLASFKCPCCSAQRESAACIRQHIRKSKDGNHVMWRELLYWKHHFTKTGGYSVPRPRTAAEVIEIVQTYFGAAIAADVDAHIRARNETN